jgi:hypothetical protein
MELSAFLAKSHTMYSSAPKASNGTKSISSHGSAKATPSARLLIKEGTSKERIVAERIIFNASLLLNR